MWGHNCLTNHPQNETYTWSLMNVRREEIETDSVYFTTLSSNLLFKRGGRNSRTHLQCKTDVEKHTTLEQ